MVDIGFVGTGVIAWAHAIGLKAMADAGVLDARVVAVYDADPPRKVSMSPAFPTNTSFIHAGYHSSNPPSSN